MYLRYTKKKIKQDIESNQMWIINITKIGPQVAEVVNVDAKNWSKHRHFVILLIF